MTTAAAASDGPLSFCRDCLGDLDIKVKRCSHCGSPRLVRHRALPALSLAHIDCDAFYATVEKRDNPEIADRPVIIGGGKRGVVSAACYIARTYGVRSAMPMFKALELCPDATVIPPDMAKYVRVGREVRQAMQALTPLVEPLSIDEAFLEVGGLRRIAGTPEQIGALLEGLEPAEHADHGRWLELMMACHHGSSGEAVDEFVAWSTSDPSYAHDEAIIRRRWSSLHADAAGRRVTVNTLFKRLNEAGRGDLVDEANRSDPADDFPDDLDDDLPDFIREQQAKGTVLDRVNAEGFQLSSTLGRHTNDKMISFYVRTPGGWDLEVGCEGMVVDQDDYTAEEITADSYWGHQWVSDLPAAMRP